MHIFLLFIIVYGGFGVISAAPIDSDLAELSRLLQEAKKYSPDVVRRFSETTCEMIFTCCSNLQTTFLTMALKGETDALITQCFGNKTSPKFYTNILSCSPVIKLTKMITDPQLTKYASIMTINKSTQDKEFMKLIADTCSSEEIHPIVCDWDKFSLADACQRKVLRKWAKDGDEVYKNKVQQLKEDNIKINNALKKEFQN